ncbi:putative beta-galactosidase GanA [Limosilactobacillus coleohominis 101-4-CHN]|uniref:Beta-galactosidase n=1 Tax=Limosilactobacillus coleohominis 101-4-CHN TaxID=575594 RepID=C7XVD3_9LACO|nr:beta-galactosidase [Limosilactobacillus coleohominis]EEU30299.1 putative beta-galactosidase GanA [Limosilactobacillus coleohominis 101-4-CHN]
MKNQLPTILYGGDYNPEQWPEDTWNDDIKVFKQADINSATVNVFSWALLEPAEGQYNFSILDKIIEKLSAADFKIVLATSTAAMPAWMFKKYPDVARVDYQGRRHVFGQRHNFCPSSPNYQRLAQKLVAKLAERYGDNPHIVAWHINNEYGGNCYCENCQRAFQKWLQQKYQTLDRLNQAWNNNVWSHTIYHWDEIVVPNELGDAWGPEGSHTIVAGLSLDYLRFQSAALQNLYRMEKRTIEKYDDHTPIMTNFHSTPNKMIDYQAWAGDQDIIAYDSYPAYDQPAYQPAFLYDLMRSLKHQPFMLMESTPSQVNWQPYSPLKRPGQVRATEFQAVAHGADTVQYFQLKQAIGGSEKFHGAVISHSQRTDTRAFQEVAHIGHDLKRLSTKILGSKTPAKVGLIFDWNNFWSYEYVAGISQDLDYVGSVLDYYRQFYERHIPTDVISVDDDFSQYDLIVAPVLYMVKQGLAEKINDYVAAGGHFLTTYMSGMVNESDNVYTGGYPGPLSKVLGIWVEETDAMTPGKTTQVVYEKDGLATDGHYLCDLIHLTSDHARAVAKYGTEFYAGVPAITENQYGQGTAWYVGSRIDHAGLSHLMDEVLQVADVSGLITTPTDLEITKRVKDGHEIYFVLNMRDEERQLPAELVDGWTDLLTDEQPQPKMKGWDLRVLGKNN